MKPAEKFLTVHTGELEWEDGTKVIGLPPGVEVKIVTEGVDDVSERVDKFVKFPHERFELINNDTNLSIVEI